MDNLRLDKLADLNQARLALAKLLPHLPQARLTEQLDAHNVSLPAWDNDSKALPGLEFPRALLAKVGPLVRRQVPDSWKPAFFAHKHRLRRSAQWQRFHETCVHCGLSRFEHLDPVVAGALLLHVRPLPGSLRTGLMKRTVTDLWGSFFAAHGLIIQGEEKALLNRIAEDPRLTSALWRMNPDLADPLVAVALGRTDIWSATMVLNHALAAQWIGRVVSQAATNELSAVTALTLQPAATVELKNAWIERLLKGQPSLACQAVRWTRFTWPTANWQSLRNQLRATAVGDCASSWFHFHRDNEPEQIVTTLREENIEVLWMAELVHHSRNYGQELRRQMVTRLQATGTDTEARLVLRWLNSRGRPRQ